MHNHTLFQRRSFGVAFIEAMFYGTPVIGGNADGSVDALMNGKLGTFVEPNNIQDIIASLRMVFENKVSYAPSRPRLMMNFKYGVYKEKMKVPISSKAN